MIELRTLKIPVCDRDLTPSNKLPGGGGGVVGDGVQGVGFAK